MDHSTASFPVALAVPQCAQACVSAVCPKHGLRLLRLVSRDVRSALMPCIRTYALRFDLGGDSHPELVDSITFLRQTLLSRLQVTIVVDDDGKELSRGSALYNIFQQIQTFVNNLQPSLKHVTDIELRMECLNLPVLTNLTEVDPSDDEHLDHSEDDERDDNPSRPKPMPGSLTRKLEHVTTAARHILAVLAVACPKIQRLYVSCPDTPNVLPYHHCAQLTTLALGTCEFSSYVYRAPIECSLRHLQPLLACLTSLTLLKSSYFEYAIIPLQYIALCTSLTYLDLSHIGLRTERWACLPASLRELRYSCYNDISSPPKCASLNSLTRCVISDSSQDWRSNSLSVSLLNLLAIAPHLEEVVMVARSPAHRSIEGLAKLGFFSSINGSKALTELHDRLSSGLKITTQLSSSETEYFDYWPPDLFLQDSTGFQLQLSVLAEDSHSKVEDDDADLTLSEYFMSLKPCLLYTNMFIYQGDSAIHNLHVCFPHLSKLVLGNAVTFDNPCIFTDLAKCTNLKVLELAFHTGFSPSQMAAAVSTIPSLIVFHSGLLSQYSGGLNTDGRKQLKEILSKSNPGLAVDAR